MAPFTAMSLAGYAAVVGAALVFRGRFYATFVFVILGIHTAVSVSLAPWFGGALPAAAYLQVAVYAHFLSLARPRLRPLAYRLLVSIPASWFSAGTFLAFPWAIVASLGLEPRWLLLPYAIALAGAVDSLLAREEQVDLVLDGSQVARLGRTPRGTARSARPIRVVQITDPHLGPFMSVERLRRIAERAVARKPDLVLLTGDFLTMESQGTPEALAEALAPLLPMAGRTFACRGNHDLEVPEVVASALARCGVRLLIDELVTVQTEAGPVEVLGIDFRFRGRRAHIGGVVAEHPRLPGRLRIAMLHDPGAFRHVPEGAADLVLSGHTHGGQLGLLWLGIEATIVSALTKLPDHGFWGQGANRLYVHRGTGHYGFPLRVGVPSEESVLHIHKVDG